MSLTVRPFSPLSSLARLMSSAVLSSRLGKLIKKASHHDKDERFMCLSDIATELDHPDCPSLEPPLITTLARTLLTALNDTSTDVQTIAVKALGLLVRKGGGGGEVKEVVERLAALIVEEGKEDSRDVYVIGMKTIIAHMSSGGGVAAAAGPSGGAGGEMGGKCLLILISGLQRPSASSSVLLAALDIAHQLLLHFASSLPSSTLPPMLDALTPLLAHSDSAVPKRAIATLGPLVPMLPDRLFSALMDRIQTHESDAYTYLHAITTISTHAGSRIRPYLPDVFTQLKRFCQPSDEQKDGEQRTVEEEQVDRERQEQVMEVYEDVLSAFEALLGKCGGEVYGYVGVIVEICLRMSRYDPNWAVDPLVGEDGDSTGMHGMEDDTKGGGGTGWDDEDDGAMDDDENENDDNSWKVRRAALRCLQSLITSKPDLFAATYFEPVFDTLVERLSERDDNVRLNVLECISVAVKECVVSSKESDAASAGSISPFPSTQPSLTNSPAASANSSHIHSLLLQANLPIPVHTRPSLSVLSSKLHTLFLTTLSIHSRQPLDTRRATLDVWKSVVGVMEGGCDKQLPVLLPALLSDATQSDVRLRTDALVVSRLVLELHPAVLLAPFVGAVCDVCVETMAASYLKLKAESLRLAATLLTLTTDRPLISQVYSAVYAQLLLTDVDAEVKEAALSTMALLLSTHHALLPDDAVEATLPVFHARLGNEVTRLSALRAITRLTLSSSLSLASILPATLNDLLQFLRRDNAILRQETMSTILALARTQNSSSKQLWGGAVREVEHYIDDRDMYVSTLAMDVVREVLRWDNSWVSGETLLLDRLLQLLQSPLMQGQALQSITALLTALVAVSIAQSSFSYERLIERLSAVDERMGTSTLVATAQCISAIVSHASDSQRNTTVSTLLASLSKPSTSAAPLQLCLYVVGSIGRHHNLSAQHPNAFNLVSASLSSPSDGVQQASAAAVGWLSAGGVDECLPQLLRLVEEGDDKRYLGLCALLRMVQTFSAINTSTFAGVTSPSHASKSSRTTDTEVLPHITTITAVLFRYCDSDDEAVRALISECLGVVTLIEPQSVLPALRERVADSSPRVREVVITAIRYAVPSTSSALLSATAASTRPPSASGTFDAPMSALSSLQGLNLLAALSPSLPAFFPLLSDTSLNVQRQALLTVTSLMHSHPPLVQPHLSLLLPLLYPPLVPSASHVRTVNLGPFQHRVDDGLPLRQAALTALATLFASLHVREDEVREYVTCGLKAGLAGELGDGVAGLVWEELERTCARYEAVLVGELDGLVADMMKSIREQLKLAKGDGADGASSAAGGGGVGGSGGTDAGNRAKDVLRACVRSLLSMQRMRGVESSAAFQEFYARVLKTQVLVTIMTEMRASER